MIKPVIIGIDPGVSAGCICILDNDKVIYHRMPESFKDIKEILKTCAGYQGETQVRCSIEQLNQRPMQNPFMNARMEPMRQNFTRLKDALIECDIRYQTVTPQQWQKFHNLVLPRGLGEKGVEYNKLNKLKKELKTLDQDYQHLSNKDRIKLKKDYEKEIDRIKAKEKHVRKKRYQTYASSIAGENLPIWKADAFLLMLYQKYHMK